MSAQSKILDKLSQGSSVIYSTHALSFVPSNVRCIVGVKRELHQTRPVLYRTVSEATEALRRVLGLKFGDFFNLRELTIAVEGPTDKDYMEWFLSIYNETNCQANHKWPLLRKAIFIDYGGVKPLQFFVQSTYEYIRRESVYVVLFDSDDAGMEARSALQSFFQKKSGFSYASGVDFISIRKGYSIEWLFSDEIIKYVHAANDQLITHFSMDTEGTVEPFRIRDHGKRDAFSELTRCAQSEIGFGWASRFVNVCVALEEALSSQKRRLEKIGR